MSIEPAMLVSSVQAVVGNCAEGLHFSAFSLVQCLYAPSLHLVFVDLVLPSLHPSTFLENVSFTFIHSIAYNKIIDEHRAVN